MWKLWVMSGWLLVTSTLVSADTGISFSRNRMVFEEANKAVSLDITNAGNSVYLIQAGISTVPDQLIRAPFLVTPPLFRLDAKSTSALRILGNGATLPRDRESVFYFYATAIPSKSQQTEEHTPLETPEVQPQFSVALKTILKLFYRPKGLPIKVNQSYEMISFVQQGTDIIVKNPTPYYQSFALLSFDDVLQDLDYIKSMVPPMSDVVFPAGKEVNMVTWSVMNDYGGAIPSVTQSVIKQ